MILRLAEKQLRALMVLHDPLESRV